MAYHRRRSTRFGRRPRYRRGGRFRRRNRFNPRSRPRRYVKGSSRRGGYYGRYPVGGARAELKFHDDIGVAEQIIDGDWTVHKSSVSDVPQGTGQSDRVGRKVTGKSISCKGFIAVPSNPDFILAGARTRLVLVHDKQCNGQEVNPLDVFEISNVDSYRNLANSGRFNILYDKTWTHTVKAGGGDGLANNATASFGQYFTINRKLHMPIEYDGPTGAVSEIQSNNLTWLSIGSTATTLSMDYNFRFRYTDS